MKGWGRLVRQKRSRIGSIVVEAHRSKGLILAGESHLEQAWF